MMSGYLIIIALAGMTAGMLVTRYAPECLEGLCWGQAPFLLMIIGGALSVFATRLQAQDVKPPILIGMLSGILIGLCVSLGGGLYAFLGGEPSVARTEAVTWMALMPNPLIGVLGGILGILGAVAANMTQQSLGRLRSHSGNK